MWAHILPRNFSKGDTRISLRLTRSASWRKILPFIGWFVGGAYDTLSLRADICIYLASWLVCENLLLSSSTNEQCGHRLCIPAMDYCVPTVWENEYSRVKS